VKQSIHERAAMVTGARMHYHAGGLVDRDHIGVLVKDRQWNRFGLGSKRR